ncbi:radical SAM protein [Pseudoalteromonas spongiae]|uniref:radical SAM protein n=1 Tax=Pseudoalteromonas spongiae TaxID=298657 RepID=UPI0014860638|nr:radical SAM protein [Pseudoalteromonas spongiae]
MSVEVRPLGAKCNLSCSYCYQDKERRNRSNNSNKYSITKIINSIEVLDEPFTLFGGEALLTPKADLEKLWKFGFEKFGSNRIQTNGLLIDLECIELFHKYNVHVGVSIDGPEQLNDARQFRDEKNTLNATRKIIENIKLLCQHNIVPSIIVTLHRLNGVDSALENLKTWITQLEKLGIKNVRLHILEVDNEQVRKELCLSSSENIALFKSLMEFEENSLKTLSFDLFNEIRALLVGQDKDVSCVWHACDSYSTQAVQGIDGNGQFSNCGRTSKDGINYIKAETEGFERYLSLAVTEQSDGGCKGCEFFFACKGQCPGTAMGNDFRKRSEYCSVWKELFNTSENYLNKRKVNTILSENKGDSITVQMVEYWKAGKNIPIYFAKYLVDKNADPIGSSDLDKYSSLIWRVSWKGQKEMSIWKQRFPLMSKACCIAKCSLIAKGYIKHLSALVSIQYLDEVISFCNSQNITLKTKELNLNHYRQQLEIEDLFVEITVEKDREADKVQQVELDSFSAVELVSKIVKDNSAIYIGDLKTATIVEKAHLNVFWKEFGICTAGIELDFFLRELSGLGFESEAVFIKELLTGRLIVSSVNNVLEINSQMLRMLTFDHRLVDCNLKFNFTS